MRKVNAWMWMYAVISIQDETAFGLRWRGGGSQPTTIELPYNLYYIFHYQQNVGQCVFANNAYTKDWTL